MVWSTFDFVGCGDQSANTIEWIVGRWTSAKSIGGSRKETTVIRLSTGRRSLRSEEDQSRSRFSTDLEHRRCWRTYTGDYSIQGGSTRFLMTDQRITAESVERLLRHADNLHCFSSRSISLHRHPHSIPMSIIVGPALRLLQRQSLPLNPLHQLLNRPISTSRIWDDRMNKIRFPCDRNSFPMKLSCQIKIINPVPSTTRHRVRSNSPRPNHCQAIVHRSKTSTRRRRIPWWRSDLFSQENNHKRKCEQDSFSEKKPRRPAPSTPAEKSHSPSLETKSSSTLTFWSVLDAKENTSLLAGSPPTTPENSNCEKDRLNEELNRQKAKLESIEEQRRSQQPLPAKPRQESRERLPKPAHVPLTKSTLSFHQPCSLWRTFLIRESIATCRFALHWSRTSTWKIHICAPWRFSREEILR